MSIYAILASKPHNPHYLKRYIRFIESCKQVNENYTGYTEKHHICPKAKDLFPEYESFTENPWNKVVLTARQHFIAHWMLWKVYPNSKSMAYSLFIMRKHEGNKIYSKSYARLSEERSKAVSLMNKKRIENGTHNWLGGHEQRKRYEDPKQRQKMSEIQKERYKDPQLRRLMSERNKKRVENGTHNWLGPETNRKRIEDGTHNWVGDGEYQRNIQLKRLEKGVHHFQDGAPCVNKQGEVKFIPKKVFDQNDEWVSIVSKEGKKRLGKDDESYLKGKVRVVDIDGEITAIEPEIFYLLKENNDDTFVAISSKEGRKRLGKPDKHPFKGRITVVDPEGNTIAIDKKLYDKKTYVMVRSKEGQRRLEAKRRK